MRKLQILPFPPKIPFHISTQIPHNYMCNVRRGEAGFSFRYAENYILLSQCTFTRVINKTDLLNKMQCLTNHLFNKEYKQEFMKKLEEPIIPIIPIIPKLEFSVRLSSSLILDIGPAGLR